MLRVVHVDHRAKELVQLRRHVADVRALTAAEDLRVTADVPNVLVASECAISRAAWERRILDDGLWKELKRRLISQCLERTFSIRAILRPKLV